jgi:hypothetical protein
VVCEDQTAAPEKTQTDSVLNKCSLKRNPQRRRLAT